MVYYVNGDLLEADVQYICHQVNCQGKMGSGIAKSIRNKWPDVYEMYMKWYTDCTWRNKSMLGKCHSVPFDDNRTVINMAAQNYYGSDGKRYTSYDAFYNCLEQIRDKIPNGSKIGFPHGIGCGFGGASWNIIKTMIEEVLGKDYEVYIYKLQRNEV